MTEKERIDKILDILEKEYPDPKIALNFTNPLELLVATILSAQCTDERVNKVTRYLFQKYRTAQDYAKADLKELEEEIKPTGFYKNKAKTLKECAEKISKEFSGHVPHSLDELITLPGVGRKTANIVLGNAFGKQAIAVDTHVKRVSNRLGLASSEDPYKIEMELMDKIPEDKWTLTTHRLIWHGRLVCKARNPLCSKCPLKDLSPWCRREKR